MEKILFSIVLFSFLCGCSGEEPTHASGNNPDPILPAETTEIPSQLVVHPSYLDFSGPGRQWQVGVESVRPVPPALPVVWSSDDEAIATVDNQGMVTAVSPGRTHIRASAEGLAAAAGAAGSAYVVVRWAPSPTQTNQENGGEDLKECGPPSASVDPYIDRVVSYEIGIAGGYHEDQLPDVVLGPPHAHAQAPWLGSFDIFSLGKGGEIVLEFTDFVPCDGDGPDLIVFENPFQIGSDPSNTYAEPGIVGVSEDGIDFVEFPCEASPPYTGCAGVRPVLANPDLNDIDPTDPETAGGDSFDLAEIGVPSVRFVRIRDSDLGLGPVGPGTWGFDLDAIAIVNGKVP